MTTKYVQKGDVIDHVAASAILSNAIVAMNDMVGMAVDDIASGATGPVIVEGVFTVDKITGTAWAQGELVDWDASAGEFGKGITTASGDVTGCAVCTKAAASGDATGEVRFAPGAGTGI